MASTSTNKQPLLIDRVFNEAVQTDGLVSGNSNLSTGAAISYDIAGTNSAKVLVNCITNDGGIVEDMYCISRGSDKKALFYLSSASDYLRAEQAVFIGSISASATTGEYTNVAALPRVLAPVPQQGVTSGMIELAGGNPLKNQALYIPTGKALWVTIWGLAGQNVTNCPIVGAQGGFY
jgi:hypothetical protein